MSIFIGDMYGNGESVSLKYFLWIYGQSMPEGWTKNQTIIEMRSETLATTERNLYKPGVAVHVVTQLAKMCRSYEDQFPALQQRCASLQTENSDVNSKYTTLQTEHVALTLLRENDQNQITNLEKKVEAEKQQQAESLRRLEEIQQQFDKEKQEQQACRAELEIQKNENIQNKRTIEEQDEEIKAIKENNLKLQQQIKQMQHQHAKEIKSLKSNYDRKLLNEYSRLQQLFDHFNIKENNSPSSSQVSSACTSDDEGEEDIVEQS